MVKYMSFLTSGNNITITNTSGEVTFNTDEKMVSIVDSGFITTNWSGYGSGAYPIDTSQVIYTLKSPADFVYVPSPEIVLIGDYYSPLGVYYAVGCAYRHYYTDGVSIIGRTLGYVQTPTGSIPPITLTSSPFYAGNYDL